MNITLASESAWKCSEVVHRRGGNPLKINLEYYGKAERA